jgi:alkylation response protein AidB-like acyl-CoA dehydrogenase
LTASRHGDEWVVSGVADFVVNAPVARLFAVQVKTDPVRPAASTLLVPRETAGLSAGEVEMVDESVGEPVAKWFHGSAGKLIFDNCRLPTANLLDKAGESGFTRDDAFVPGGMLLSAAINLGIGRAASEAAVDYAKLRKQGGRQIIEHQAIGTLLADMAIKLEAARNMVWKAAWASDHPDAYAEHSLPHLSLQAMSKIFVSEMVHEVTERAAECFGAMGVMLDMPLTKYVHDSLIFIHSGVSNSVAKFRIAEAVAGYRRPPANCGSRNPDRL